MDDAINIVALRGVRGMIADKMQKSLQEAAQLTHHAQADVSSLISMKERLSSEGTKVSIEDLIMHVVCSVLGRHSHMNGVVQGKEVHLHEQIHLSMAMALPGNLLVAPAIFNASRKQLGELREARQDLSARAKSNKLTVPEMTNGTFTISNLGLSRVHHFTPILNTPQIALLGIGSIVQQAAPGENDAVLWKPVMGLSLTFDHRAVDGAPAADFLTDICKSIESL
ncbi:MAG: acetoin dehydrogenase [Alteromonadaceae bacterium]|jgi:pyruvate dehydrogenase E2 component (dihydrolipoamide acetyltransferase)|nr:acetoin dehydrogenase [Alteromonadaceae bacterium]MBB18537.1 acetoin dehydrogenase [Rickettsiales bacterium]